MKPYLAAALLSMLAIGAAHAAQTSQTPPPPPPAADAAPPPRGMAGMGMRAADTDGDGRISRAEFAAASQKRFDRMDANGDGFLDASEMAPRGGRMRPDR